MKKFYDTCALLNAGERAFAEPFYISMVTLRELENIKTSRNKDAEVKHKARKVTRLLDSHPEMYTVANYATVIPSTSIALHDGSPDYLICYDAAILQTLKILIGGRVHCVFCDILQKKFHLVSP